jgi:hypothetical protein
MVEEEHGAVDEEGEEASTQTIIMRTYLIKIWRWKIQGRQG